MAALTPEAVRVLEREWRDDYVQRYAKAKMDAPDIRVVRNGRVLAVVGTNTSEGMCCWRAWQASKALGVRVVCRGPGMPPEAP